MPDWARFTAPETQSIPQASIHYALEHIDCAVEMIDCARLQEMVIFVRLIAQSAKFRARRNTRSESSTTCQIG